MLLKNSKKIERFINKFFFFLCMTKIIFAIQEIIVYEDNKYIGFHTEELKKEIMKKELSIVKRIKEIEKDRLIYYGNIKGEELIIDNKSRFKIKKEENRDLYPIQVKEDPVYLRIEIENLSFINKDKITPNFLYLEKLNEMIDIYKSARKLEEIMPPFDEYI